MRNWLTVTALVVFIASTGMLAIVADHRPTADLPPAMAAFGQIDDTATSGIDG